MNRKSALLVVVVCVSGLFYSQNNTIFDSTSKEDISINNTEITQSNSTAKDIIPLWKGCVVGFAFGLTQFNCDVRQYNHYPAYQETGGFLN